jgi:formate dehydrogenase maturation protein FdhE
MRFLIFITSILSLVACQPSAPQAQSNANGHTEEQIAQQEQKRLEVMAVHDAVMPEMSTINRLSRTLRPLVKEKMSEDEQEILLDALKNLQQADEGMMNWMADFHNNLDVLRDSMDHQAIMSYLGAEFEKIKVVDTQMRSSIETGKKLVDQYGLDQNKKQ